jgi:hypothetical protein
LVARHWRATTLETLRRTFLKIAVRVEELTSPYAKVADRLAAIDRGRLEPVENCKAAARER